MNTFSIKELMVEYVDIINNRKLMIGGTKSGEQRLAMKVHVDCCGFPSLDSATICIYNLSQDRMNELSYIQNRPLNNSKFSINVYSIEDSQQKLVFSGDIVNAYPVYQQVPDVFLQIEAITDYHKANDLKSPLSLKGAVKVQEVVANIAKDLKKSFTNNGIDKTTENLYLEGSNVNRLKQLSNDFDYNTVIDRDSLIISEKGIPTKNVHTIIDCDSGLVQGYIMNDQNGITLTTYYYSGFQLNGKITIKNAINSICNGDYVITKLTHDLVSVIQGEWSTTIKASYIYER